MTKHATVGRNTRPHERHPLGHHRNCRGRPGDPPGRPARLRLPAFTGFPISMELEMALDMVVG